MSASLFSKLFADHWNPIWDSLAKTSLVLISATGAVVVTVTTLEYLDDDSPAIAFTLMSYEVSGVKSAIL